MLSIKTYLSTINKYLNYQSWIEIIQNKNITKCLVNFDVDVLLRYIYTGNRNINQSLLACENFSLIIFKMRTTGLLVVVFSNS